MLYLSNRIHSLASRERSLFYEHTGAPPTREGRRERLCEMGRPLRWETHSHRPRAALESPIVRPREEFGEIGVISPLRIKEEASRKKERQGC